MSNGPFYASARYRAKVLEQALGKAQTGTTQFILKVRILECLTPVSDVQQYERTIYMAITESTMQYVVPKLQSIGYTRDSLRYLSPSEPNHHSFVGQEINVFCKHENDRNGDLREKWDIARSDGSSKPLEVTPVDKPALRNLDMLFGKALKEAGATTNKPAKPMPPPRPDDGMGVSDLDCPF